MVVILKFRTVGSVLIRGPLQFNQFAVVIVLKALTKFLFYLEMQITIQYEDKFIATIEM